MTTAVETELRARERLQAAPRRDPTIAVLTALAGLAVAAGVGVREELYLSPERGAGYALGILGLTLLVLLLGYPARKRIAALRDAGPLRHWFRVHMILGVLAPVAIGFHANFQLGSVNSAVAVSSMLLVVASGYLGRFVYARVHRGLYGERRVLAELQHEAREGWDVVQTAARRTPGVEEPLQRFQAWALDRSAGVLRSTWRFATIGPRRRHLQRRCVRALRTHDPEGAWFLEQALEDHLGAVQRVAQLGTWERIFSLWHAVHLPLCFLLFAAAAVHVVAVHAY